MLLPSMKTYWTTVINMIIQNYLLNPYAVCLIMNKDFDIELELEPNNTGQYNQFLIIQLESLADSLYYDVFDFKAKEGFLKSSELVFDDLVIKLIAVFESSFCEAFVAFQDDIEVFLRAYHNASMIPDRYVVNNHFIFAYSNEMKNEVNNKYYTDMFLRDQSRILIIEAETVSSSIFTFKTNRFVGSRDAHPEELYELNRYDADAGHFLERKNNLFPEKMNNQQGREIILGVFDYRPFVAVDFNGKPNLRDRSAKNPKAEVLVDGTEVRVVMTYCELYNCTVEVDTSEDDWGYTYPNMSGYGVRYRLANKQVDMTMDASYHWITRFIDKTHYIGYSAITLLVPKPFANISWNLPLRPFQFTLWLGVFVYLFIETLSLLLTRECEQKMEQSKSHSWISSIVFGYSTTLKLFVSQSSGYNVTSSSLRTLLFACYMNDIIITSIYGGGLASMLTLPTVGEAPDTIDKILKFKLIWAATTPTWLEPYSTIAKGSRDEKFVKLYRVNTVDELRDMAEHGYYGFIVERMMGGHFGNIDYLTFEAMDRLKLMIDNLFTEFTTIFIPRGWAMEEHFNRFILNWHAGGFGDFWEWKVASDFLNQNLQGRIQSSKYVTEKTGPEKLDIKHVAGLMLIVLVGSVLGILVFALEILHKKYDLRSIMMKIIKRCLEVFQLV